MTRAIKRALLFSLVLAAAIAQAGCWDHREVEDLGIVLATGIDQAPGGRLRIIVQNVNPKSLGKGMAGGMAGGMGGASAKAYRNRSVDGDTMFEAFRELSRQTPRRLFYAHNQVILISDRLARERGVKEIMDFLERNPQIRRTTWLLVAKGDLAAILDEPGRLEDNPAQRIFGIINERQLTSQYAVRRLGDFLQQMAGESSQPFTAVIERVTNLTATPEHRNRLAEGHLSEPHHTLRINGTAVFRGDKMAGWLNSRESRGLLWVRGEVKGGVIDIPGPEPGNGRVSLEILRSKTGLKPEISDGQVLIKLNTKVETNLGEVTGPVDVTRPETLKKIESQAAGAVRSEIESALAKAQQEYGVDIFGFGEAVHRKDPRQWKKMKENWADLFPGVQVQVLVDPVIRRTGMITKPLQPGQ